MSRRQRLRRGIPLSQARSLISHLSHRRELGGALGGKLGADDADGRDRECAAEYRGGAYPVLLDRFVCNERDKPIGLRS